MKTIERRIMAMVAVIGLVLTGCARNYVITMNNGRTLNTASKPKLEKGFFVWKDAKGEKQYLSQSRVREVSPASMAKEEKERFKP